MIKRVWVFTLLTICNMLTMISLSLITPFFPPFADQAGIPTDLLGYIISANPIGAFISSLILGKLINENNRFNYIMVGMFIQGLGLMCFVITKFVPKYPIIALAIVGRLAGGIGTSFFMTPFFAFVPILYPNDVEKKISISELVSGFGQLAGPVFGSLLYSMGGYTFPFLFFGIMDFLLIPVLYVIFTRFQVKKNRINTQSFKKNDMKVVEENEQLADQLLLRDHIRQLGDVDKQKYKKPISYIDVFIKYPVIMQFLCVFMCNICFTFFQPTMATYYQDEYQIGPTLVGYLMSIVTFFYAISTFVAAQLTLVGLVMVGACYLFMGPDKTFTGIGHNLAVMLIAQAVLGAGNAIVYIPAVPLLNEILEHYYPGQKTQTANTASAIFTSGMSLGQLVGPISSGYLAKFFGFPHSCSYLGFAILFQALVYLFMFTYKFDHASLETVSQQNKVILRSDSNSLNPQFTEYLFSEYRNSRLGIVFLFSNLYLDKDAQFYFDEQENTSELGAK